MLWAKGCFPLLRLAFHTRILWGFGPKTRDQEGGTLFSSAVFPTPTPDVWEVWLLSAPRFGHFLHNVQLPLWKLFHPNNYRRWELMFSACHPVPSGDFFWDFTCSFVKLEC